MGLFYLNPDDEPRECPAFAFSRSIPHPTDCPTGCNGTGRLGGGKGPEIKTLELDDSWAPVIRVPKAQRSYRGPGWYARGCEYSALEGMNLGPFPTESAALEAARAAHKGVSK